MMKNLVKANPWVVFLMVTIGGGLVKFSVSDYPTTTAVIRIFGMAMCLAYPLSLQQVMQEYVPIKVPMKENFYLLNGFVWFAAYSTVMVLSGGEGMVFTGWGLLLGLYVIFAYLYFLTYPAKVLWCAQRRREARIGEYYGDALALLFLPVGIWFLQPKVKRILQRDLEERDN